MVLMDKNYLAESWGFFWCLFFVVVVLCVCVVLIVKHFSIGSLWRSKCK